MKKKEHLYLEPGFLQKLIGCDRPFSFFTLLSFVSITYSSSDVTCDDWLGNSMSSDMILTEKTYFQPIASGFYDLFVHP